MFQKAERDRNRPLHTYPNRERESETPVETMDRCNYERVQRKAEWEGENGVVSGAW